jgi:TonB family protein
LIRHNVKILVLATIVLLLDAASLAVQAQGGKIASPNSALATAPNTLDREIDGLRGVVYSVRTERSKLNIRSNQLVEEPRILFETITYDQKGNRTDGAYYPVSNATLTGKEEYEYDDRGNNTKTTLRGSNGRILRREVYSYEFDSAGNWIKMITSVASSEGGKSSIVPAEVTYRTITYYPDTMANTPERDIAHHTAASDSATSTIPRDAKKEGTAQADMRASSSEGGDGNGNTPAVDENSANGGVPATTNGDVTATKALNPVRAIKVSGGVLNGKAIFLPQPPYPAIARSVGFGGTVVVEIQVDETGKVVSARVVKGPSILRQSAVQAAYRARFSPTLLSGEPVKVSGEVTYNFILDSRLSKPNETRRPVPSSETKTPVKESDRLPAPLNSNLIPDSNSPKPEEARRPASGSETKTPVNERDKFPAPLNSRDRSADNIKERIGSTTNNEEPVTTPENTARDTGVSAAASTLPASDASTSLTTLYRIGIGDVLEIRSVLRKTGESSLYTVTASGFLDYPLAGGPVKVTGMTADELSARLSDELKRRTIIEKPEILVSIREYVSHTVVVSGSVDQPGTKILRVEAMPLYAVLAKASPRVEAGRVVITSGATSESRVIDLLDPAATRTLVHPGDVLHVSARPPEFFYIGGEVKSPGRKEFYPHITLTQALLESEGLTRSSSRKIRIKISRQDLRGRLYSSVYGLSDIEAGQVPDPGLQPGDRVMVSREP